jgi:hypothetical protein
MKTNGAFAWAILLCKFKDHQEEPRSPGYRDLAFDVAGQVVQVVATLMPAVRLVREAGDFPQAIRST